MRSDRLPGDLEEESSSPILHFMLSMPCESVRYLHSICSLSGIFFLLYFSVDENENSSCTDVFRKKKKVLKCRVMYASLNDKGFGPMSIAGPMQLENMITVLRTSEGIRMTLLTGSSSHVLVATLLHIMQGTSFLSVLDLLITYSGENVVGFAPQFILVKRHG